MRFVLITALLLAMPTLLPAGEFSTTVEGGGAWFSRNDVRIPGDTGTEFDMMDLIGDGPDPYVRLSADYAFNDHWATVLDVEGLGSTQGRAIDAALTLAWQPDARWTLAGGYRTLEGGADNSSDESLFVALISSP